MSTPASDRVRGPVWRGLPWLVAVVVTALVAVALTATFWDQGPGSEPGTVVDGYVTHDSGNVGQTRQTDDADWTVRLPYGAMTVSTSVGRVLNIAGEEHETDGAARWVGVRWHGARAVGALPPVWPGADRASRQEPTSRLFLVAGERRYPVLDRLLSTTETGALTIAVADADDLHLVVVSGGTERRAAPGPADELTMPEFVASCRYDQPRQADGVEHDLACTLRARRASYVPGLGWAPRGKSWVIVDDAAAGPSFPGRDPTVARWTDTGGDTTVYYAPLGKPTLTLTVSHAGAATRFSGTVMRNGAEVTLQKRAYLVPTERATRVRLTYRSALEPTQDSARAQQAPARPTVEATALVDLPAEDAGGGFV